MTFVKIFPVYLMGNFSQFPGCYYHQNWYNFNSIKLLITWLCLYIRCFKHFPTEIKYMNEWLINRGVYNMKSCKKHKKTPSTVLYQWKEARKNQSIGSTLTRRSVVISFVYETLIRGVCVFFADYIKPSTHFSFYQSSYVSSLKKISSTSASKNDQILGKRSNQFYLDPVSFNKVFLNRSWPLSSFCQWLTSWQPQRPVRKPKLHQDLQR